MNTVTLTFFKLSGLANKFWGFQQMGLGHKKLIDVRGLQFFKLLGCGSGNRFNWFPDFSTYALLCVWQSEEESDAYFSENAYFRVFAGKAFERYTVYMHTIEAHGLWSGQNPFEKVVSANELKPLAVLTRARIRVSKLIPFWSRISKVSQGLDTYPGQLFAYGIGELPIIQQVTFSIWQTPAHMKAYAYNNPLHKEVIKLTRENNWYAEELFGRYIPFRETGTWNGKKIFT